VIGALLLLMQITWGPFLHNPRDGAVTVNLEAPTATAAEAWVLDEAGPTLNVFPLARAGGAWRGEIQLAPGRIHWWAARATGPKGDSWSPLGACRLPVSSYRVGIWGDNQLGVAPFRQVLAGFVAEGAELLLGTGDYIQNEGSDADWRAQFAAPIGMLARYLPLMGCRGNHDGEDQLAQNRWPVPGPNAQPASPGWRSSSLGPAFFIVLDSNQQTYDLRVSMRPGGPQRVWLEQEVRSAACQAATWRVAVFHHPPKTEQWDGGCFYPELTDWSAAMDLLAGAGVHLVLNGHAHSYQRGAWRGMAWVVTGGGGGWLDQAHCRDLPEISVNAGGGRQVHHFLTLDVGPERLLLRALDLQRREFDRVEVRR